MLVCTSSSLTRTSSRSSEANQEASECDLKLSNATDFGYKELLYDYIDLPPDKLMARQYRVGVKLIPVSDTMHKVQRGTFLFAANSPNVKR
jgi:hypothetical protein